MQKNKKQIFGIGYEQAICKVIEDNNSKMPSIRGVSSMQQCIQLPAFPNKNLFIVAQLSLVKVSNKNLSVFVDKQIRRSNIVVHHISFMDAI